MKSYARFSYQLLGDIAKNFEGYFIDIKEDLQSAKLGYTILEYISMAFFTTAVTFFIETILLAFIFSLIGIDILSSLLLSLTLSFAISGTILFLFYSYPATVSKSRGANIEKSLPFAISYLAAISSGNVPPSVLFKTLSQFKEYGEVSKEAGLMARDVEMFGMPFSSALKRHAQRTPSRSFRELLWGINAIISSGGDLVAYMKNKSDEMMDEYRRKIRKYAQDLSLFVEIYLTLIMTGSIFFIVLSSVISTISGGLGLTNVQGLVVFVLLPGISLGFIIVVKAISPTE